MAVGFRGATLSAPGVATYIDDSKAASTATYTPNSVAIVGEADRGQPGVAVAFTDASAVNAFYGPSTATKPLTDGLVRALAAGSSVVYGVRTGRAKPFTASLYSSAVEVIRLTTKEYGRYCKAWSVTVASSTNTITANGASIGKKITLKLHDGSSYTADNIGKSFITLLSNSATATGGVAVTSSGITLINTESTPSNITYTFANYPRLNNLVAAINQDGKFIAAVATGTSDTSLSNTLDALTATATTLIPIYSTSSGPYVLTSTTAEIVSAITTGVLRSFLTATFVTNAAPVTNGTTQFSYYTSTGSSFTGTIATTVLTVSAMNVPITSIASTTTYFTVTHALVNAAAAGGIPIAAGSQITIAGCSTTGYNGTWTVSSATTTAVVILSALNLATLPATPGNLAVNGGGTISVGQIIAGTGVTVGTYIVSFGTGTGGTGTYNISVSQSVASAASIVGTGTSGTITDYDPDVTSGDWTDAFVALQSVPSSIVVPMSDQASYHSTALAHAQAMSLPTGRSERIAICGGALGETYLQAQARAGALNDKRGVLVWPGIKDYDDNQFLVDFAPFHLAAQIAGLLSSQTDEAEPLTNQVLALYGLETVSSNKTIDSLVNNGVFTVRNDLGRGFVVVQGLTTWTGDMKMARREIGTVRAADAVMRAVRGAVQRYIGAKSSSGLVSTISSTVEEVLSNCSDRGLIYADPANPTRYPAYGNIVVKIFGDAYYIDFNISPAKPVNYLLITAYVS